MVSVRELNYGMVDCAWIKMWIELVYGIGFECVYWMVVCYLEWFIELCMGWLFKLCIDLFILESELNGWIEMWFVWNLFHWILECVLNCDLNGLCMCIWYMLIGHEYGNVMLGLFKKKKMVNGLA